MLKWAPAILFFFCACNRRGPTYLQLISQDMWKGKTTKDNVLCISRYKETANYIHFLAVFEKKPYEIDSLSMTAIEQVDTLTIYHNKFQRESNDYKSLIKKRILKLTGPVGYNEFDGYIYLFKKKNK